jgi:CIC family chloride channel protein
MEIVTTALRETYSRYIKRPLVLSVLVGLVAGVGAVFFSLGTDLVEAFFLGRVAGYHSFERGAEAVAQLGGGMIDSLRMEHRWFLFLIPVLGGLFSGWLVYTYAPEAEGHGTDAAIDAFHNKKGLIRHRVPFVKGLASMVTIGTGGSAGREGPIAQIGAGISSFLATRLGMTSAERRLMLMAGMAGGVGATFRAPLGGAIFAVEVLYREPEFEHEGLLHCIISSIIAYSLYGAVTGWTPLLDTPLFRFNQPTELITYLFLGLFCALLGAIYIRVFYGLRDAFHEIPMPNALKPALGGLLIGILAMAVPQVLGSGYGWVQLALYGKISLWIMLVIALAKILATSFTISSGGSGGVFAPSLVIGAMVGGTFGAAAEMFFPAMVQDPRAYVLVGMAGFFAGVANAPITSLIMVSEMTGNYGLLAPLMLVCIVAMIVFRHDSIYEKQVPRRADSPAHLGDFVVDVLEGITAGDLVDHGRVPTLIPEHLPLHQIVKKIASAEGAYYPVVDKEGHMTGIFSVNDIRRILDQDLPPGLVLARDIAVEDVITLSPDEPLTLALQKLSSRGLEEIPVVDHRDPKRVIFMLTRRSVLARYTAEFEEKQGAYSES